MDQKDRINILKRSKANVVFHDYRTKNNIKTNEFCPVVGVTKKKPKDQIPDDEILPDSVDVVEIGPFYPKNRDKHRPLEGGISGHWWSPTPYAGTLGLIVKDKANNKLVGLTNNHCAGDLYDPSHPIPDSGSTNTTGLEFTQPSIGDGGNLSADKIGTVLRAVAIKCGGAANYVDGALIDILTPNLSWFNVYDISTNPVVFNLNPESSSGTLRKSGRTTFVTTSSQCSSSIISYSDNTMFVPFGSGDPTAENNKAYYHEQIIIGSSSSPFIRAGDSGSVLLRGDSEPYDVIGLLFAGSDDTILPHYSLANRINNVSTLLNIDHWDGTIIIPHNTSETITLNGRTFTRHSDTSLPITHSL